jgi:hypothetical protein
VCQPTRWGCRGRLWRAVQVVVGGNGTQANARSFAGDPEENQKTLSGYDVEPVELIDSGDQVVAVAQVTGVGPVSQIAMDGDQFAFLFTIKNGRVVREQAFRNKDEAFEAAGLRGRPISWKRDDTSDRGERV